MSYRDGKMSIADEGDSCPFCAGAAHWKKVIYQGSGASGMEAPELSIGCPVCRIWLPSLKTEEWAQGKGYYSVLAESSAALLTQWNKRMSPDLPFFPSATFSDRMILQFRAVIARHKGKDLAREMDVSEAYVSQIANRTNPSLRTMARFLFAVERLDQRKVG